MICLMLNVCIWKHPIRYTFYSDLRENMAKCVKLPITSTVSVAFKITVVEIIILSHIMHERKCT